MVVIEGHNRQVVVDWQVLMIDICDLPVFVDWQVVVIDGYDWQVYLDWQVNYMIDSCDLLVFVDWQVVVIDGYDWLVYVDWQVVIWLTVVICQCLLIDRWLWLMVMIDRSVFIDRWSWMMVMSGRCLLIDRWLWLKVMIDRCMLIDGVDELYVLAAVHKGFPVACHHLLNVDPCLYLHVSVWRHQRDLAQYNWTHHAAVCTPPPHTHTHTETHWSNTLSVGVPGARFTKNLRKNPKFIISFS